MCEDKSLDIYTGYLQAHLETLPDVSVAISDVKPDCFQLEEVYI